MCAKPHADGVPHNSSPSRKDVTSQDRRRHKAPCRVPLIMQLESLECGAACLAMVLAHHGLWLPLERVRRDCGVSRDGSKAVNILKAARSYGLLADGYSLDVESLREVDLPAIIHWNFNHFVVLRGFKGAFAYLNDPARGAVRVSMDEFRESFTGIALIFQKGPDFAPSGQPVSVASFVRTRLAGTAAPLALLTVAAIMASFAGIANATFSRVFMDRILTGVDQDWLLPLVGVMAVVGAVQCAGVAISSVSSLRIQGVFCVTASSNFVWHLLRLPVSFYGQRSIGDLQQRQTQNETIAYSLVSQLAPSALNVVLIAAYLAIMLRYSVPLALVGLLTIVLNLAAAQHATHVRQNTTHAMTREQAQLYSSTITGIDQIESIKASGAEDGFFAQWSGHQAALSVWQARMGRTDALLGAAANLLAQVSNAAVLAFGVWLIVEGSFTCGMLLAFQGFLSGLISPVNALTTLGQQMQEAQASMERIEDVMRSDPDVREEDLVLPHDTSSLTQLSGRIDIDGLCFGYGPLDPPVVRDLDLHVRPGEWVALVGESGCGKSTIARLVAGLYPPREGTVRLDGMDVAEIPHAVLRGSLGVVDQDVVLFDATVADNIRLWDQTISDGAVYRATHDARIHEAILSRPKGYATMLTSSGANLSGGERQRLEIARVLAQDPSILILDEATSALDARTEQEVMDAIRARGVTCLVVAHRLSAIRDCDQIVVLDGGRIVERGTHEELMARDGAYARLLKSVCAEVAR